MDITWFGLSCFLLRSGDTRLLTDPFNESLGYPSIKIRQAINVVTMSNQTSVNSYSKAIKKDNPNVVDAPGEYEIKGVFIEGIHTFHNDEQGNRLGTNTIYTIEMDGLMLCHLGILKHPLSSQQVQMLNHVEILMLPVGGVSTINAETAAQIVRQIEPRLVIPMHFQDDITPELEPVDHFLQEMGVKDITPQPKLTISKTKMPDEPQVVLLERHS
ncbi:MAG: MBL fold metallo-hydrolase [Dehalococcoidia bacterium]|nr:MBL fold metallo-hydrolase [Dehalococcoidia bacterium]